MSEENLPMVSVIIPTYNAGAAIGELLKSIEEQSLPCELLIIDSGSTDNTVAMAMSHDVHILDVDKGSFNHGATRNLAARYCTGEILVFLTQDALLSDNWSLEALAEPLSDRDVAASYGRQVCRDDASPPERFARLFNYPEAAHRRVLADTAAFGVKTFFFSNVFSAMRRKEFEEVEGFPENVVMFEDMIFAAKLLNKGYTIAYAPEAQVIHSHNHTLVKQFQRYYAAGVSFKRNPWFMQYARADSEGIRFLKEQMKYLWKTGASSWMPYALAEASLKYAGYRIGLKYGR